MRSFFIGLGIGMGLGFLLAPVSGRQARETIRRRASNLAEATRSTVSQGRERISRGIEAIRAGSERLTGTESS